MRKILAGILLLCALAAHAQDEWYIGKPIKDFTFTGLQSVSSNELNALVQPYIGKNFTLGLFYEIQEKLYALDYFESIESNALPADGETAVIVEFIVKEKPTVADIVLEGNRQLRRTEILEKVLIKKGDMVTQAQVNADADAIAALYLEKGFTEAKITGSLEPGKEANTVQVRFRIVEGVQTAIRAITFSGNSFASESTLRRLMKTKAQSLFSSGLFQEAKLEEDLASIREYYGEHGFVDAKIDKVDRTVERDEKEGKNFLTITIYLTEGEQWIYGGMKFEGNQIFSTEQLEKLVRQTPGKILDKSRLEADTQRVADLYYENGYIFNVISRDEARDEKKKEISYTIHIVEKDRAHIESIQLKGNTKTKDYVILRELPFQEGDIFSKAKVLQGLRNLYNLQYFTSIQPETPQGSAEGLMDLVLNLEEGSTANINFGVTFSGGDYPISGVLKWSENNFLGRGQAVGVDLEISNLRQLAALSFTEPWLFGKRWSGGVSLSFEHALVPNIYQDILGPVFNGDEDNAVPDPFDGHRVDPGTGAPSTASDAITDYEYAIRNGYTIPDQYTMDYTTWKFSLGLDSGYRYFTPVGWLGVRGGVNAGVERVEYDPTLYRPFDPVIRSGQGIWQNINKLALTLFWDKRDYFLNPSKGFYLAQGVTFAAGLPAGRRQYTRTDSTAEGFLTLVDWQATERWKLKLILAAYSSMSFILPPFWDWGPNGKDETITNDRLYIDGWNIARGWPLERDLKALWDNRLELRIPISEQLLWGVFFFDAVAGYEQANGLAHMQLDDFRFGFGGGIRFAIPQFPIRLYLAKRFRRVGGEWQWQEGDLPFFGATVDFVISLGGDTF
jgi:outer membrane protein insertion porin family